MISSASPILMAAVTQQSFTVFSFCTSTRFPVGQLKLDAPVELQGDESIGCHHDNARDEEEQQQQRHVPERYKCTVMYESSTDSISIASIHLVVCFYFERMMPQCLHIQVKRYNFSSQ